MSKKIALSSQKNRTDSKQGQKRGVMTPTLQAHAQTHMSTHRCTETHTNRERAAPSAPALTRANTDSIETLLLSVGNIMSCSGLKAPYGEMFFYGVDVSDGSLGGARLSWIDPYSDASCTPPPSYIHIHAITHAHIKQNRAGVCGKAKTWNRWLNAGSCSLSLCVYLNTIFICLLSISSCAFSLNFCSLYFNFCDFLHSTFFRS